jgi:predicted nucleic acid-binding protein
VPDYTKIYLDACALNRLMDDPGQMRVAAEAEAVLQIFQLVQAGNLVWVTSAVLEAELRRNPNTERREDALAMLRYAGDYYVPDSQTVARAKFLQELGYGQFDALHLAAAELSQADILITTDDRFLNLIRRKLGNPLLRAENPLNYMREMKP